MIEAKKHRILIVDDVSENIQTVAGILDRDDHELSFALSGPEALELAYQEDFDLILLDIMMPEMSGFDVIKRLKSEHSRNHKTPVIFLTAKTETESVVMGFELGAVDYVTKPVNSAELRSRVNAHLTIVKQQRDLERINAAKDRFFGLISHDLRSQFTALLSGLDYVVKESSDPLLEMVQATSNQLYGLMDNLLQWSRVELDQVDFRPEDYYVGFFLEYLEGVVKPFVRDKDIRFETDVDPKITIFADLHMVQQILRSLLTNACKYSSRGGLVRFSVTERENDIHFVVADQGVGMNDALKEKIFDLGYRVSRAGTEGEKGTGLGLIVTKSYLDKQHGKIWFESQLGEGTSFHFTLPKAKELGREES